MGSYCYSQRQGPDKPYKMLVNEERDAIFANQHIII